MSRSLLRTALAVAAIVMLCVPGTSGCAHTEPFRDEDGRPLPNSLAVTETWWIGGVPQRVWLRGRSLDAPLLVLVHGGPGASETALFRAYDEDLERHFVVLYWDQRGAGRSYNARSRNGPMTIERFVEDLDEVVERGAKRLGRRRAFILGHSWGSVPAILYSLRNPGRVAALITVSPAVDYPEQERRSWEWASAEAARLNDRRAARELRRIGPPPHTVSEMLVSRGWVDRFGGSFHAPMSKGDLIRAALATDEADPWDLVLFGAGNRFSLEALWPELRAFRAPRPARLATPVVFILGRYDHQAPSSVAAEYFNELEAPCKQLVWFGDSAHNPPFEEADRFVGTVASVARWAGSADCAGSRGPAN